MTYKGVIFTLGETTAEKELESIRCNRSPINWYFDSLKEVDPIDDLYFYTPEKMPEPKRFFNLRPIEGRIGRNYILIILLFGNHQVKN